MGVCRKLVVLHGLPGAGKGTLGNSLAPVLPSARWISCGDLIREAAKASTRVGRDFAAVLDAGQLAPDLLVNSTVFTQLRALPSGGGTVILDGYPRTSHQADALLNEAQRLEFTSIVVLNLTITPTHALARILARRVCEQCEKVYNLRTAVPRTPGRCDKDGANLAIRRGDEPEHVAARIETYARAYLELSNYYTIGSWTVQALDGLRSATDLLDDALHALEIQPLAQGKSQPFKKV